MPHAPIAATVIASYPFPGWLELAAAHVDALGPDDREELEGLELEHELPRRFGPPAHDERGRHRIVGDCGRRAASAARPSSSALPYGPLAVDELGPRLCRRGEEEAPVRVTGTERTGLAVASYSPDERRAHGAGSRFDQSDHRR